MAVIPQTLPIVKNGVAQQVRPWYQGQSGATAFTRHEAQRFARSIVESDTYRETLWDRIKAQTLPPAVEQMLWYYSYGRPLEQVNVTVSTGQEDLSALSVEQLQERARAIYEQLEEAKAIQNAIAVEFTKP